MKKINTGSSDFSDLRKENVIYVDKTAYMRRLASDEENKVVFMSRPRRFGKSLTVSAFKALFHHGLRVQGALPRTARALPRAGHRAARLDVANASRHPFQVQRTAHRERGGV